MLISLWMMEANLNIFFEFQVLCTCFYAAPVQSLNAYPSHCFSYQSSSVRFCSSFKSTEAFDMDPHRTFIKFDIENMFTLCHLRQKRLMCVRISQRFSIHHSPHKKKIHSNNEYETEFRIEFIASDRFHFQNE